MNGQMYQIASIVAAGKRAMQSSNLIKYEFSNYENSIEFDFLPQKGFFKEKKYTAPNVSAWFGQIKEKDVYKRQWYTWETRWVMPGFK